MFTPRRAYGKYTSSQFFETKTFLPRSVIKRQTDSSTSTMSGQTNRQTSITSGEKDRPTATTSGQTNGQKITTSDQINTINGQASTTSGTKVLRLTRAII